TSSTGSRLSAWPGAYQAVKLRMSCPDFDCASAATVNRSLSPLEVMNSTLSSTFSFSAHSRHNASSGPLAPATQPSQNPTFNFPAAWAPRTKGLPNMLVASAAVRSTVRRVIVAILASLGRSDAWRQGHRSLEGLPAVQIIIDQVGPLDRRTDFARSGRLH